MGRRAELAIVREAVSAPTWPFHLLTIVGPPGVGKSALLREIAFVCEDAGIPIAQLDLGTAEDRRDALDEWLTTVAATSGWGTDEAPARQVLLVDGGDVTQEQVLHERLLRDVPVSCLVIVASRSPTSAGCTSDAGLRQLQRTVQLRPLTREESLAHLQQLQVPHFRQPAIADRANGVPLVHSLAATFCSGMVVCCRGECAVPEMVHALAGTLLEAAPSPLHRRALYAGALLRRVTSDVLAAMLEIEDAHDIHRWLATLTSTVPARLGLRLVKPYRQALEEDLRWRNPSLYRDLEERGLRYCLDRIEKAGSLTAVEEHLLLNALHLRRRHPGDGLPLVWEPDEDLLPDAVHEADRLHLLTMVRAHEGDTEADRIGSWMSRRPEAFTVCRDGDGAARGFILMPVFQGLRELEAHRADPVIDAVAIAVRRQAPERVAVLRSWMSASAHQRPSAVQTRLLVTVARLVSEIDRPVTLVLAMRDPGPYAYMLRRLGFAAVSETQPGLEGLVLYRRTFRAPKPLDGLIQLLEGGEGPEAAEPATELDPEAFEQALRQALKDFTAPDLLMRNPLLDTRLVVERAGPGAPAAQRLAVLREEILAAAETLAESPRRRKGYEALHATYLEPAPTQEEAAASIDMAFSTYRRHLGRGIRSLAEILRNRSPGA